MNESNPLGLHIGNTVRVIRKCTVQYTGDKDKELCFEELPFPIIAVITGIRRKALGTYSKGYQGSGIFGDAPEYEPPVLVVSKYVRLYECRLAITSKPFMVHPDDLTPFEESRR